MVNYLKRYISKLIVPISIQLLFTALYSITVALFPVLNKHLFDNIIEEGSKLIPILILAYLVLILLNSFFQYIARIYEWIVEKEFNVAIKSDLFLHVVSMKQSRFKEKKESDYLSVFNNNIATISEDYISAYVDIIKSLINIVIFSIAILIFVNWKIAIVVLCTSIIAAFVPKIMRNKLSRLQKVRLTALSSYFQKVLDLLSGKKRINSFTIDAFEVEHSDSLYNSEDKKLIFGKVKVQSDTLNALSVFFIQLCTFTIVAIMLVRKEISVGAGIAAFGYVTSLLNPIRYVLSCINCINSTKETVEETLSYLDTTILKSSNKYSANSVTSLELRDLSFVTDQFSLEPFSYKFEKGKKYALIGHSGSGKSTLLRMIDGSIDSHDGDILVDGKAIESLDLDEYIFSIDQFEHLFQTDYKNNVTVFNSLSDEKKLSHGLLNKLKTITKNKIISYDSVDKLSGGEKQIIHILRMLVADCPIILLDESFSSVDKTNIKLIKDYLMSLEEQIVIEVTHDTSEENLSNYDTVIIFDEGTTHIIENHTNRTV